MEGFNQYCYKERSGGDVTEVRTPMHTVRIPVKVSISVIVFL
jgi:hypothetical protein